MSQLRTISVLTVIIACVVVAVIGLNELTWPITFIYTWPSKLFIFSLFIASVLIVELYVKYSRSSRLLGGAIVACLIAVVTGTIWPLLVTTLFFTSSYIVGIYILNTLKLNSHEQSRVMALLTGVGAYGTVVGLLAHYPINYSGLYVVGLIAPVLIGRVYLIELIESLHQYKVQSVEYRWLDLCIVLLAILHFSVALMPEIGHDALGVHLFIPGHLAYRHEWGFDVTKYVWAVMPMLADWIFSIGYMLAGETAARLINVGFGFVICILLRDLVLWAGGNALGGRWAILIFLVTPLTYTETSSLFVELIWTSFVIAGSLLIFQFIMSEKKQNTGLALAGLMLGYAVATKAVTFVILPVLALFVISGYQSLNRKNVVRYFIMSIVLFISIGAIPYITAWLLTGNPVFPFFNMIFQSPYWDAINFKPPEQFTKGVTLDVLYQVTFNTEKFLESKPAASGFQWLLIFIPSLLYLVYLKQYKGIVLIGVACLSIILTFNSTAYLRYVFPSFVWLAAGIGVAISYVVSDKTIIRRTFITLAWLVVGLNFLFFNAGTYYGALALEPLMSEEGREAYINKIRPIRNAVEAVNKLNQWKTPVVVFSSPLTAGIATDALYPSWYNYQFSSKLKLVKSSVDMAELFIANDVEYVIVDNKWGAVEKREYIETVTDKLATYGDTSIHKLKNIYLFGTELIKNPELNTAQSWNVTQYNGPEPAGDISVNVKSSVTQLIEVSAGKRYRNIVSAKCKDESAQGRVQVNWLGSGSKLVSADIHVFDCTDSIESYVMDVVAPRGALTAVVYAIGHTEKSLIIDKVSFRK